MWSSATIVLLFGVSFCFVAAEDPFVYTQELRKDFITGYDVQYKHKDKNDWKSMGTSDRLDLCKPNSDNPNFDDYYVIECETKISEIDNTTHDVRMVPIPSEEEYLQKIKDNYENIYEAKNNPKKNDDADFVYVTYEEYGPNGEKQHKKNRDTHGAKWRMLALNTPDDICSRKIVWEKWQKAVKKSKTSQHCPKLDHTCNYDHFYTADVTTNTVYMSFCDVVLSLVLVVLRENP